MPEELLAIFSAGVGTLAAVTGLVAFLAAVPFAIRKNRWPEVGEIVLLVLAAAGMVSGVKITVLTLFMDAKHLGALADDKPALFLGGIAAFYVAFRETVTHWRKVAGF